MHYIWHTNIHILHRCIYAWSYSTNNITVCSFYPFSSLWLLPRTVINMPAFNLHIQLFGQCPCIWEISCYCHCLSTGKLPTPRKFQLPELAPISMSIIPSWFRLLAPIFSNLGQPTSTSWVYIYQVWGFYQPHWLGNQFFKRLHFQSIWYSFKYYLA